MKKWRIWLLIIFIILAIAGGNFAYTYLTATQQISVTPPGGDIASVEPYGNPSWDLGGRQAGTLPTTTLYGITPSTSYTGNLLVLVYLTNTGELIPVYQHLNMRVELRDKDDVRVGRLEYLTLDNGVVRFELNYGTSWNPPYYVKITGGSYNTLKGAAGSGESFSPFIWVQVRQR